MAVRKRPSSPSAPSSTQPSPKLKIVTEPAEYFKDLVGEALEKQRIQANAHIEFYLVNLLTEFMRTDHLYEVDQENGALRQEALAKIFEEALRSANQAMRQKTYKRLGDLSLYTAGFFSESFNRKIIDVTYYIDMGRNAYDQLSNSIPDEDFRKLFGELASRFHQFVDVLSEISEKTHGAAKTPQNLLRMYEYWLRTKSERAAEQLKEVGILPIDQGDSDEKQ